MQCIVQLYLYSFRGLFRHCPGHPDFHLRVAEKQTGCEFEVPAGRT